MRRIYGTLLITFLIASKVLAQDSVQVSPQLMAETITIKLHRELDLSEDQKELVYLLLLERSKSFDKTEKSFSGNEARIKEEKEKIDLKAKGKFKKVLTEEQFDNYQMLKAQSKINKMDSNQRKEANIRQSEYLSEQDEELDF